MPIGSNGHYSIDEVLSYNAKFTFVGSGRGIGKSYGWILKMMKFPGETICLTRTKTQIQPSLNGIKSTLLKEKWDMSRISFEKEEMIPGQPDQGDMKVLKLDGKTKVMFLALQDVETIKRMCFQDTVDWVWMDEFVPIVWKALQGFRGSEINEGEAIRAIMKTIDHDSLHPREERGLRKLRFVGFFNPFTWSNPIIQHFKLIPKGYGITKVHKDIVLELVEATEYEVSDVDKFLGDKIHTSTQWLSASSMVEPIPKGSKPLMSITMNQKFTAYTDQRSLWISKKNKQVERRFSLEDFPDNGEIGMPDETKNFINKQIRKNNIRFDDINTKFEFMQDWLNYA